LHRIPKHTLIKVLFEECDLNGVWYFHIILKYYYQKYYFNILPTIYFLFPHMVWVDFTGKQNFKSDTWGNNSWKACLNVETMLKKCWFMFSWLDSEVDPAEQLECHHHLLLFTDSFLEAHMRNSIFEHQ